MLGKRAMKPSNRRVRNDALEEAAKVCDTYALFMRKLSEISQSGGSREAYRCGAISGEDLASKIRALRSPGK
jgi:hypothetical protein